MYNSAKCPNLKPMDITFMNRKLKMKFYVKEKKKHEYFSGQIVSYDGVNGKYGEYTFLPMARWSSSKQRIKTLFT
jgi:hypothetical protein